METTKVERMHDVQQLAQDVETWEIAHKVMANFKVGRTHTFAGGMGERLRVHHAKPGVYRVLHTSVLDGAEVGDGATYRIHSDCQAGTVIKRSPKSITIRLDKATLLNGMNSDAEDKLVSYPGGFGAHVEGVQRHSYEPNPNGSVYKFTRRVLRNGRAVYKLAGHRTYSPGCELSYGRHEHYDYNY